MSKYAPLQKYLEQLPLHETDLTLEFGHIEEIIGDDLPPSAYKYRQWWSNNRHYKQAQAWLNAGWKVEFVSFARAGVWLARTFD